jgi:hypothetical protein
MLVGMTGAAQLDFTNNIYTHKTKNGYGVERELKFKFRCTQEQIMNSIDFNEFMQLAKDEGYRYDTLEKSKLCEMFVINYVGVGLIDGKYKLKKPSSLDYIEESIGLIYVSEDDNKDDLSNRFVASIQIKAQNGYGNYLFGKFIVSKKEALVIFD